MTQHTPKACDICAAIAANPAYTNAQLQALTGAGERTIRRHKNGIAVVTNATDEFFSEVPEFAITSRGKSVRLEDGSWEKVTYKPKLVAMQKALNYDDCLKAIENYRPNASPLYASEQAEIFALSDAQMGKAHETGGGSKDTVQRILDSAFLFKQRVQKTMPRSIVITDLGDAIENIWNVPNHQLTTNDLDVTEQIRWYRRVALEVIKMLAPLAPEIYYVAVPSNHGQVRNAPGSSLGDVDNDFGIEISYQLEDICVNAESEVLRNVVFVRPEKYYETATLKVSGTKLAFNHGHRTSGGIKGHDRWWTEQDHGRMPGWDADIMVVAHYHSLYLEHSGNGRWIIGVSASEPSSDYFALSTGKRSKRGVTCFTVNNGVWSNLEIL